MARLSVGTRLTLGAMSTLRNTVAELLSTGTCESTLEGATTYAEANRLMASRRS